MRDQGAYLVTRATESDLDELVTLINSAYRGEPSRAGWTTEADFLEGNRTSSRLLRMDIEKPRCTILCLREKAQGPILGSVFLELFEDSKGPGCYLGMLTVNPNLQTQGLGKAIMQESEEFARRAGAQRIVLRVIQLRESLMAWYERRGYQRTGETQAFPYDHPEMGIPQRDDLHFVVFEKNLIK